MIGITFISSFLLLFNPMLIVDFVQESDVSDWRVVDDGVMGGRSAGHFSISEAGHGVFSGDVSLDNNGGFSSLRNAFPMQQVSAYQTCVIRLKGDGKRYQFRLQAEPYDRHSYMQYFETTGEWQTIELPFSAFSPTFRGRQLAMPPFPGKTLSQVSFLIANKRAESFRLEIDWIRLH